MLRATKVRICPTQEQTECLIAQLGTVRFAYHKARHIKTHMSRCHGVSLSPQKKSQKRLKVTSYRWK